jgi:hypothetical protein
VVLFPVFPFWYVWTKKNLATLPPSPKKVIVAGHFYVRQNNQPALGGKSQYFFL